LDMKMNATLVRVQVTCPAPRFAIALAAYNGMHFIAEQMQSILNQSNVDVSVFVSVDRSCDGTEQWVEGLAVQDHRINLLEMGHIFGAAAPNFFRLLRDIDLDGFDYFAFADQDDIWMPDKLMRAHLQLQSIGADGYSSNVTAFWPSGERKLINKAQPQRAWDYLFESAGPGCTYVMTTRLARELQVAARTQVVTLQRITFHDWFAYAYARSNGFKWIIDSYPSLLYRQHAANQFGANSGVAPLFRRMKQLFSGEAFRQLFYMARAVQLPDAHPVSRMMAGGTLGMISLAMAAPRCRRKGTEQLAFFISCIAGVFIKFPKQ
jgi:rhamnosyltransferase